MAVDQKMGPIFLSFTETFGKNDGVARRFENVRREADALAVDANPVGASGEVVLVLGLGGDAGKADVFAEFLNEPLFVALEVIQHLLHGGNVEAVVE